MRHSSWSHHQQLREEWAGFRLRTVRWRAVPQRSIPGNQSQRWWEPDAVPGGRAVYNGLQTSWKEDVRSPLPAIHYLNLQVSYAYSRYVSMAQDSDFINSAWDAADPTKYMGPNGLDRTHQFSFGGTMELPEHFRINMIGHFYSPLPQTLTLATTGSPGGIFVTDVLGDGTGDGNGTNGSNGGFGGILPGTNLGSFGRGVTAGNINRVINNYNTNFAGNPTPAGQALITAGLMTQAELFDLHGVMPEVSSAPLNEAGDGWLRDTDLSLNWTYKIKESVELQPGVGIYNLFNFGELRCSQEHSQRRARPECRRGGSWNAGSSGNRQRNARTTTHEPSGRAQAPACSASVLRAWLSSR